jgi:hypothetical protein
VAVGLTIDFTANVVGTSNAVTWSVTGGGSIDSTSGVYTAPSAVPTTQVVVVATVDNVTGSAIVNVTSSQSIQVAPANPLIPAGATQTFAATSGGNPVGSVTWQVNGVTGGDCSAPPANPTAPCHGTIDGNGNYIAPLSPPPGGVTISALSGTDSGTATPTIQYSSASLTSNGATGQYAIQYAGSDFTSGFPLDIAGSISTSGSSSSPSGTIIAGGQIDINSLFVDSQGGAPVLANVTGGTFTVGPTDGRSTLIVQTDSSVVPAFTLQLALTTNQHGLLIDIDTFGTGSGTIDAQNASSFAGSLSGNYSFTYSGLDPNFVPLFVAGTFTSSGGSIPVNPAGAPTNTQDVVDQGLTTPIVENDITLNGSYTSSVNTNGRGTIALNSTTLGTLNFAFYLIDQTHANIVEIDTGATPPITNGQIYSAPTNPTALTGGIAFTSGGSSGGNSFNPYVIGGTFPLNASSIGTGGLLDINTSGKSQVATPITSGSYSGGSTGTGIVPNRYLLNITSSKGTIMFAAYPTTINTALLVQIDKNTDGSTGTAYQLSSPAPLGGSFATNLTGVGASKTFGQFEQDVSGQVTLSATSTAITSGTLDLNSSLSGPVTPLPIKVKGSSFNPPLSGSTNRGTAVLSTAQGPFSLTYYLVSPTTAIYIDTDSNRVAAGVFLKQF